MEKRTKLLILNRAQFGYHIDSYYYCKYLNSSFNVTYMCWDYKYPYIEIPGVKVVYVSRKKSKIIRYANFVIKSISNCQKHNGIVFIDYFPLCFLIKLFAPHNKYVVDIRTGYIVQNIIKLTILNYFLSWEARLFRNITIISSSLARKLGLDKNKTKVIPLGADIIFEGSKQFNELRLIYVGTFHMRNLEQTILGFAQFYRENKSSLEMSYVIIGAGYRQEEKKFEAMIKEEGMDGVIRLIGSVKHENLKPYFEKQNVGVSYIPLTSYFDCQPPTKTFEYMLSGMPVIATSTYENSQVVNNGNGVLINDDASSFREGLKKLVGNKDVFDSMKIRRNCEKYKWEHIINNNLKKYLIKL